MNAERFTLDTNVLVYAIDRRDAVKHEAAKRMIPQAAKRDCVLTIQALSEFYVVASRKRMMPISDAAAQVRDWLEIFPTAAAGDRAVEAALAANEKGRLSYWDALLLATAGEAGCTLVLSEDMKDGARLGRVTVRDPFARASAALLARLGLV